MKVKLVNNNGLKKEPGLVILDIGETYYVQKEMGCYYYINSAWFKKTRFVIVP